MIEERLDRIEGMITQLIQMVGENNGVVKKLEQRMDGMEQRMDGLERRMDGMEQRSFEEQKLNAQRHQEILKETRYTSFEIDYLRNQSAKHDMDIHILRQR